MGGGPVFIPKLYLLFCLFLCSGTAATERKTQSDTEARQQQFSSSISTTEKDITTPITTVPTPTITPTTPTSSTPIINPTSTPETTSPLTLTPGITPATTTPTTTPVSSGASWCVATQSASYNALQVALDYACGVGGADCSAIQPSGSCYNPNTLRDHASYAFNQYYQKNPIPSSCNFGGTAVSTSTNPSSGTCQYPSTSTSSSVLNTTNSNGATVYGAVPNPPSPSTSGASTTLHCRPQFFPAVTWLFLLLAKHYE
ncbi:hypothetical protein Patl1_01458 [Pistacia atlantica]|uniref:Uncharacterized protein n=1 Tax=Pistacia atlantica TaxID=434234 RepID=A0ACC1C7X7_9ROSI|nr:hypothetical protein Patl1_01458 [Pistacia atlantica]